jgi:hypothetical protein
MALAIPLFWLGYPGWAVSVGFVAFATFWLTVLEPYGSELLELHDEVET